ncbi:MAG: SPOR domain-containing protein [Parerythrobacter sp.]
MPVESTPARDGDPATGPGADNFGDTAAPLETTPAEEAVLDRELELADEDAGLPWLDTNFDDEEPAGYDTGRLIGFFLVGLLIIGLIIAALWFFSNRGPDPDLVADGSTIEAPDGPVKVPPESVASRDADDGSESVAAAVSEGQTREGRLAEDDAPRPSINAAGSRAAGTGSVDSANGETSGGTTGTAAAAGGTAVQVGAYSSRERAVAGWSQLTGQTEVLSGVKYRVVEGQVDGSTVYRLQAVVADNTAGRKLCAGLKADGLACQVK